MIQDILGQLGFDWKVAIANLINFLIIYYLLRNVVFRKISIAIKERQNKIEKGLADAELAENALVVAQFEKAEIVADAYKEAHKIADKAEIDRKNLVLEAKQEAVQEAQKIKDKGLRDIEKERISSQKKLESEYVDLVIAGIETMAKKEIRNKESEGFALSLLK